MSVRSNRLVVHRTRYALLIATALALVSESTGRAQETAAAANVPSASDDYLAQVKPLLKSRCYACHGALKQEAHLRLDTAKALLAGGDSGPAATPGDAEKSLIVARVATSDVAERMPPEHEGEAFSAAEVTMLRRWIAAGARHPDDENPEADPRDHWAFRPIVRPAVPMVKRAEWVRNPIDAFIAQQYEQRGLAPQPEASRVVLLRRLSLDLIGLPPTPEEVLAIESDQSPDWYERAVARLLKDPRHGERWARHWMDVWRYSDWWGLGDQLRRSQKHIWRWRDWIVESLNDGMPYDEMVRLMLAGDELAPNDLDKLRATGFLARNFFIFNRHQWMDETVEHVSKGFLGLTTNCAKCHDHKYDPISQVDYYQLRAFFEPYQVRLDILPEESDLARDGLPRIFDAQLDAPTYRLERGDEARPDKSTAVAPGVPSILGLALPAIEPIDLPVEAWKPERRAWIGDSHRQTALKNVAAAEATVAPAREKLASAEKKLSEAIASAEKSPPPEDAAPASAAGMEIVEKFATLDPQRWKLSGGEWVHQAGRLEQKQDGATESSLRWLATSPTDFDVVLRVTIQGGSQWRSVGLKFDATDGSGDADSAHLVYMSACASGSKVQAAWRKGQEWRYPAEAMQSRMVSLNEEHTLRVQVRGQLINASLDGEPAVAWRSPLERRAGALEVITFDAIAVVHEVSIAPLSPDVVLREPGGAPIDASPVKTAEKSVTEAKLELLLAEQSVADAQADLASVEARWQATLHSDADDAKTLAQAASRAERAARITQARIALTKAELTLLRAADAKREAATNEVATAQTSLEKLLEKYDEPSESFTPLTGAQWTATRFRNSGSDDPPVSFPAQSTGRRRALAEWIVDRRNPLTARVAANHIWTRHFGSPLVPTMFDFGRKGAPPTHPELLDLLACELIESGWNMKHLHELIVQSSAYRLSSSAANATENLARDGDNIYLWRRTPSRLEAEAVRDSLLALAGTLDETRGGPSVQPAKQAGSKRRSLYFFHSNNERNQFLTTFDEALVNECYRRETSIVPQQALAMTNSKLVLEAAAPIAAKLTSAIRAQQTADNDAAFVRLAFLTVLAIEPSEQESQASLRSLDAWKQLPEAGKGEKASAFARANLIWVLLNHNDFVTVL